MKRFMKILLILVVWLSWCYAETDEIRSGISGSTWNELSKLNKLVYIKGIYSGIMWGRSKEKNSFITNTSIDTVIDGLDTFYQDFRNRNIIVIWGLKIVTKQIRGDNLEEIKSDILIYRKVFSTVIDKARQ